MNDIFKPKRVWEAKFSIAGKKFGKGLIYTAGVSMIAFIVDAFQQGNVPQEWVIYTGLVIAVGQSVKKGLEIYEPKKDK